MYTDSDCINEFIIVDNLEKNETLEYITSNVKERILILDYNLFWNKVISSYQNEADIWNQFQMDLPRCEFFINGYQVFNPIKIRQILDYNFSSTIVNNILMLSTQVLMGTPYEIISNSINKYNWYFSEIGQIDLIDRKMYINLFLDKSKIIVQGKKKMRIFKLDEEIKDKTIFYVDINLEIELISQKIIIKLYFKPI